MQRVPGHQSQHVGDACPGPLDNNNSANTELHLDSNDIRGNTVTFYNVIKLLH